MPKRKKSTKRYVTVNQEDNVTVDEVAPAPKDDRFTIDEAIEWFANDPHEEEFVSLDKMGTAVAYGNHYIQFKKGMFTTSDPAEVEILLRAKDPGCVYGIHFVALNPILRNVKT